MVNSRDTYQLGKKFTKKNGLKCQYIHGLSNYGYCDASIAPLICDLNNLGYYTKWSCSGITWDHQGKSFKSTSSAGYIYFIRPVIQNFTQMFSHYFDLTSNIDGGLCIHFKREIEREGDNYRMSIWYMFHNVILSIKY